MNKNHRTAALAVVIMLASIWAPGPALAGGDHDHGEALATVGGPALPRFAAESENFELVGVVAGQRLTLYLDRYADGSPVEAAQIELDIGGMQLIAERHADGEFEAMLPQELAPGVIPVSVTILAGDQSDLLAADLDIHDEAPATASAGRGPATILAWGAAVLAALLAAGVVIRRRHAGRLSTGGAA